MNTLLAWFNSPEWMIVVKTLLHTLWQAGGLALLLWLALRRVATPAARYRLTLGTLATILGATLLTWALLNQSTPKPIASDYPQETIPAYKPSTTSPTASFGEPSVIAYATPIAKPAQETSWSGWLALTWLLGAALMLTRAGIQVAGAERLRRSCKPLDDSRITQLLAEAQRALNLTRRIRVAVTDKLTSPAVVGVIVPTLILPLTLLTTLTPEQIRFILLHELAHIRRGDYFANLFQLFIEALLFFNPAVWWISHQVRREREACCDALAIELSGAPVDYARTLLHVAETVLNPPPAAATAFSDNPREPSSLTDRLQRLLVPGYRPALRLTWRAMLAAIVVGGTLLFLSAVGARNVVGAVSTNAPEKATKPATNVVENVNGKSDLRTNGFTRPKWEGSWNRKFTEVKQGGYTFRYWSPSDEEVLARLEQIKFERVLFQSRKLTEVVAELEKALLATDPEKNGFGLMLPPDWEHPAKREGIESVTINMPSELRDTTMRSVLDAIVSGASRPIRYQFGGLSANFAMQFDAPPNILNLNFQRFDMYRKTFLPFIGLDESVIDRESQKNGNTNLDDKIGDAIRSRFLKAGIDLRPPNYVLYKPEPDLLYVYAPRADLDKVEALLKNIGHKSGKGLPEYAPATNPAPTDWTIDDGTGQEGKQWFYYRVGAGNSETNSARTATRYASSETFELADGNTTSVLPLPLFRRRVEGDSMLLKNLPFVGQLFSSERSRRPKQGSISISNKLDQITFDRISFDHLPWTNVIKTVSDRARKLDPDKRGVNLIVNPNTAETAPTTNAQPASTPLLPPRVLVTIMPELTNATLRQVLDAIVKGAEKPITYHLEEYAVVFSLKGQEIVRLESRVFHFDPDTFMQGLDAVTGFFPDIRSTNDGFAGRRQKNGFVVPQLRANGGSNQSGQSISSQTRTNNMENVHAAARKFFLKLGVNLDPSAGKTVYYFDRKGDLYVRATSDELDTIEQAIRVLNTPPPQVNIKVRWVEIPKSLLTLEWLMAESNAFLLPLSGPKTHSNLLTEQEMADVIQRIESGDGIKLLCEGQVTTLTGRQAQIAVNEVKTVVTGISTNKNGSVEPEAQPVSLGPVFDVLPAVTSDSASIHLTVIPTFTEFVGYDTNTAQLFVPTTVNGGTNSTILPLPIFRTKQTTHSAVVPDGRTLILGNFPVTEIAKQPNGEMRTNDVTSTQTNLLFILVTPTIIDPAGNRAKPAPILNR